MHVVTVEFTLRPGQRAAFEPRMIAQARASLEGEPGCLVFEVCADPADPDRIFLYEVYRTPEDFADHLASPHFRAFDAETASMLRDKSVRILTRLSP